MVLGFYSCRHFFPYFICYKSVCIFLILKDDLERKQNKQNPTGYKCNHEAGSQVLLTRNSSLCVFFSIPVLMLAFAAQPRNQAESHHVLFGVNTHSINLIF